MSPSPRRARALRRRAAALMAWACLAGGARAAPAGGEIELYFELKLLVRDRVAWSRVAVDAWAGGRLQMRAAELVSEGERHLLLRLERPLEHPWVFRWYPTHDELKLGAAVWVPAPRGDPYGTLAAELVPQARRLHDLWWDADGVVRTAPAAPAWIARAERFWAEQHAAELDERDALAAEPVYPFHVLGDARDRFVVQVRAAGGVVPESVAESMSGPWLERGWPDWLAGKREAGYGYWAATGRPRWEPRTYPAFAAALQLLAWPCPTGEVGCARRLGVEDGMLVAGTDGDDGPVAAAWRTIAALLPRAAPAIPDRAESPPVPFRFGGETATTLEIVGDSGDRPCAAGGRVICRVWRYVRRDRDLHRVVQDEVQVWMAHREPRRLKAWIRVGLRPYSPRATGGEPSGG